MANDASRTQKFSGIDNNTKSSIMTELEKVYHALEVKGYNPVSQMVGYLLSGDPTYITAYNNARNVISKFENYDILEEIVGYYFGCFDKEKR